MTAIRTHEPHAPAGRNPAMTADGWYFLANALRHEEAAAGLDAEGRRWALDLACAMRTR